MERPIKFMYFTPHRLAAEILDFVTIHNWTSLEIFCRFTLTKLDVHDITSRSLKIMLTLSHIISLRLFTFIDNSTQDFYKYNSYMGLKLDTLSLTSTRLNPTSCNTITSQLLTRLQNLSTCYPMYRCTVLLHKYFRICHRRRILWFFSYTCSVCIPVLFIT